MSPSRDYCVCRSGFGLVEATGACALCPRGTYSAIPVDDHHHGSHRKHYDDDGDDDDSSTSVYLQGIGIQRVRPQRQVTIQELLPCVSCNSINPGGNFTTLAPGSSSAKACVCQPGYGGVFCSECPVGSWSSGGSTKACKSCVGSGSTTTGPGATSPEQCTCEPGHGEWPFYPHEAAESIASIISFVYGMHAVFGGVY